MPYVPSYKHDVFISYAVADNGDSTSNEPGWVDIFEKQLKADIQSELDAAVDLAFWRDKNSISFGEKFGDAIHQGIVESAVLIILLSKRYLASRWCEEERENFLRAVQRRRSSNQRVFVVCLTDPKRLDSIPGELSEIHHVKLWRDVKGRPIRVGNPIPATDKPDHQDFFNEVCVLAFDVADKLNELRKAELDRQPPEDEFMKDTVAKPRRDSSAIAASAVYLTVAPIGTAEARFTFDLHAALNSSVPPIPTVLHEQLPKESEADSLLEVVKCPKLFVQVVGNSPPPRPAWQNRLGAQFQTHVLIWKQSEISPEQINDITDRHRALIAQARKGTLDEAVRAITEKWEQLKQPSPREVARSAGRKYLINHFPEDRELCDRIYEVLLKQRIQCLRRPWDGGTEAERRAYFERKLLEYEDMVLVYGRASRLSANDQAELCYQVLASQRDLQEREAHWIVVSGPPQLPDSQAELDVGLPNVHMQTIDGRTDLEVALAAAFGMTEGGQR